MMSRATFVFACALVVACGGSSTDPAPSSSGGTTPAPTGDVAPGPAPVTPTREGHVSVHTTEGPGTYFGIFASASFGPKHDAAVGTLTEGCKVVEDTPPFDLPEPASDSAGTLDIGVVLGAKDNALKLEFDSSKKQYDNLSLDAEGHATGSIHVMAPGDVVPAFDVQLSALTPMRVDAPASGAAIGNADLPIKWSFDGDDHHAIIFFQTLTKTVRCYAPKGREVVVPSALVSEVLASQGDLRLMILAARTEYVEAGDYRISVSHNTSTHVDLTRE